MPNASVVTRVTRLKCFTVFLFLFTLSFNSYAWNAVGHMVIADIAYQKLQPSVREKVDSLVGQLHKEYPEIATYKQIAYWPDALRSQKIETFTHWHYIDTPYSADGTPAKSGIDTDNAAWAIKQIEVVVKNNQANTYDRARFLAFLTHIAADLHQPLHTLSLFSSAHPHGDRGGNAYMVSYNNQRINVHKIWDAGVGIFTAQTGNDPIREMSTAIMAEYPESHFGDQVANLVPEDWVKEGVNNAKTYVYVAPENQPVPAGYITTGQQISKQRAALAGYRLAAILNKLLA